MKVLFAESDEEIRRCFPALNELRPHLSPDGYFDQVKRQQEASGYRLVYLEENEILRSVAGFRILESLAWGNHMYVDDLVTLSSERSKHFGEQLFDWLISYAREIGCTQLHLDSGIQRFDTHRFYMKKRMAITCHHFALRLN